MMSASVVIRTKDEAASIGRTLRLLAEQDIGNELEIIVVDSGSTDDTVSIARQAKARIIEIPSTTFTFGGALNTGCEQANGAAVIALSAHAFPQDTGWARRMVGALEDQRVACAAGYGIDPEGQPLTGRRVQGPDDLRRHPQWGYSNACGVFRHELWRQRAFREDMPGTEDKEWAAYWIGRGYLTVVDPALSVDHRHDDDGVRLTYARSRREWEGFAMYLDLEPYSLAQLRRAWWRTEERQRRLSWRRVATLAGEWSGRRRGRLR
jgi:rhamnosyltransferase